MKLSVGLMSKLMNRANRYWLKSKELESVIQRVREVHFSYELLDGYGNYMNAQCYECRKKYPCPTIKILDNDTQ